MKPAQIAITANEFTSAIGDLARKKALAAGLIRDVNHTVKIQTVLGDGSVQG